MNRVYLEFKPTQNKILDGMHAQSSLERMIGLLRHNGLSDNQAMLIGSCKQVHTFFMKFEIDAIFVDRKGIVVGIETLKPWRLSKIYFKANSVIETAAGWSTRNKIKLGSQVEVIKC